MFDDTVIFWRVSFNSSLLSSSLLFSTLVCVSISQQNTSCLPIRFPIYFRHCSTGNIDFYPNARQFFFNLFYFIFISYFFLSSFLFLVRFIRRNTFAASTPQYSYSHLIFFGTQNYKKSIRMSCTLNSAKYFFYCRNNKFIIHTFYYYYY